MSKIKVKWNWAQTNLWFLRLDKWPEQLASLIAASTILSITSIKHPALDGFRQPGSNHPSRLLLRNYEAINLNHLLRPPRRPQEEEECVCAESGSTQVEWLAGDSPVYQSTLSHWKVLSLMSSNHWSKSPLAKVLFQLMTIAHHHHVDWIKEQQPAIQFSPLSTTRSWSRCGGIQGIKHMKLVISHATIQRSLLARSTNSCSCVAGWVGLE